MIPAASRFLRMARVYVWILLVLGNLTLVGAAVLLWFAPDNAAAKVFQRQASPKPPAIGFR